MLNNHITCFIFTCGYDLAPTISNFVNHYWIPLLPLPLGLQTTQSTSFGTVTLVTNCCVNCVETSRCQQWGPDLSFFFASWPCGPAGWLALLLIKADDVETNPEPTTTHKQFWICDIYHKQIHCRKKISIRCNWIEHWVPPSTMYRYMDLSSTQIILTQNSH